MGFFKKTPKNKESQKSVELSKDSPDSLSDFFTGAGESETRESKSIIFPKRIGKSTTEKLSEQSDELMERGGVEKANIFLSWSDLLSNKINDVPFFTAYKGTPCIGIKLSHAFVSNASDLMLPIERNWPVALCVKAFESGIFPILRVQFLYPDNPTQPLILETAINFLNADFQDFCNVLMDSTHFDLVLTHPDMGDKIGCSCSIPQDLKDMISEETQRVASLYQFDSETAYSNSVSQMEAFFPSSDAGTSIADYVKCQYDGKNQIKGFSNS
jgi:hypothetical protein